MSQDDLPSIEPPGGVWHEGCERSLRREFAIVNIPLACFGIKAAKGVSDVNSQLSILSIVASAVGGLCCASAHVERVELLVGSIVEDPTASEGLREV